MRSYFDSLINNYYKPILCIYGRTNDLFVDGTLRPTDIEHALHRELMVKGFDRIVFFKPLDAVHSAYFYDRGSYDLWHGRQEAAADSFGDDDLSAAIEDLNEDLDVNGNLLQNPQTPPQKKEAPGYAVDVSGIIAKTREWMTDSQLRSAIIFPNGIDGIRNLIQGHKKEFTAMLNDIVKADLHKAKNVLIFIIGRDDPALMDTLKGDTDTESIASLLAEGSNHTTWHLIPNPEAVEIELLLNYMRLKEGLSLEIKAIPEISKMLASKMAKNCAASSAADKWIPRKGELFVQNVESLIQFLRDHFISEKTALTYQRCLELCGKGPHEKTAREKLEEYIGLEPVKDAVRDFERIAKEREKEKGAEEITQIPLSPRLALSEPQACSDGKMLNLHMIVTGNKGVGKNTSIRLLGEILYELGLLKTGQTVERTPESLKGVHLGESADNTRKAIADASGGVLFIDEAYALNSNAGSGVDVYLREIENTLMSAMENNHDFALVFAGYHNSMEQYLNHANEGFRSRFAREIQIPDYTPQELTGIFLKMAAEAGVTVSAQLTERLPDFFLNWYNDQKYTEKGWANAREVRNLVAAMITNAKGQKDLTVDHLPGELKDYENGQSEKEAMAQLQAMVGLEGVKEAIRRIQADIKFNIRKKTDITFTYAFAGPPGTGKSNVARIWGNILKGTGKLKSGRVTETRASDLLLMPDLSVIFDRSQEGVLFIDEAEGLLESPNFTLLKNKLLYYTDPLNQIPICVIIAGYPSAIERLRKADEGLARRFSNVISFESYTIAELMQILDMRLEESGYRAEKGFREKAERDFIRKKAEIDSFYNADYPRQYLDRAIENHNLRLDEKYSSIEEVPEYELYTLTEEDAD